MIVRAAALSILSMAMAISGCATVIHGTTQRIRLESIPAAADAHVGTAVVTTPGEITLDRKNTYDVEFTKSGYLPEHAQIRQESSGAVWGNLLLGGIIGILVDSSNGAAYELVPTTVTATLAADPASPPPNNPAAQPAADSAASP